MPLLVIIHDLDVEWPGRIIRPFKTDASLPIDTNAVLSLPVTTQGLEMVTWQQHQTLARYGSLQDCQTLLRLPLERLKFSYALTGGEARRAPVAAVRPDTRVKVGSELAAFGQRFGGLDLDVRRQQVPADPAALRDTAPFQAVGVPVINPWEATS
jgi:hypothetical protein